jgi:hypothetical protein
MKTFALSLVALAALAIPTAASARPTSTSFAVVGYEYAFTQTVGSFAGSATGNAGDTGLWNATVQHDPLGSMPTYIDGGTFAMTTVGSGGHVDYVDGKFVHHGGTITVLDRGLNCTNQRYLVAGALDNVRTRSTSGGSGAMSVVLTHYRHSIFGHCLIYKARIAGTVSFAY